MPRHRAALALLATLGLFAGASAHAVAQMPPYTAYGLGLRSGAIVTASIGDTECGRAKVSGAGNWKISIWADAPCHPREGDTIHFALNGKAYEATARWSGGGAPLNPRIGIALGTPTSAAPSPKAGAPAPKALAPWAIAGPRSVAPRVTPTPRILSMPRSH